MIAPADSAIGNGMEPLVGSGKSKTESRDDKSVVLVCDKFESGSKLQQPLDFDMR